MDYPLSERKAANLLTGTGLSKTNLFATSYLPLPIPPAHAIRESQKQSQYQNLIS